MKKIVFLLLCMYCSHTYAQSDQIELKIKILTQKVANKQVDSAAHFEGKSDTEYHTEITNLNKRIRYLTAKEYINKIAPTGPVASLGIGGFSGFGHNMQNKKYQWQQVPNSYNNVTNTSNYILTESGYTEQPIGINLAGNLIWSVNHSALGLGPSLGLGLTIQGTPHAFYMLGGSVCYYRFVLTAGMAAMFVSKLSNNQMAVSGQQISYTSPPGIQYNKELKTGLVVSISYCLFSK